MKSITKILSLLLLVTLLGSCTKKNNFDLAAGTSKRSGEYTKLNKINQKYSFIFGKKFKVELKDDRKYLFTTNYKLLTTGKYDMAVISNINYARQDSSLLDSTNIRSVIPINSRILYIAYNKNKINPKSIEELFEGKNVAILSNETVFIKSILTDFGVDIEKVNFLKSKQNIGDEDTNKMDKHTLDSISQIEYNNAYKNANKEIPYDIEIGFSSQNFTSGGRLFKMLNARPEFVLYSLDDYTLFKNGSKAEGFCLKNKYFTPYLLPKGAFGEFPTSPIITIREDYILAAREDVDDEFIYDFVKTAIEETDLIDMVTYGKSFENISFAFPLHEGTKRYLDKNAPKFYEKYGELIGKIGAGIGGAYTALMGFILWRKKRRRKTIIDDYQVALNIQNKLNDDLSIDEIREMYKTIQKIQTEYQLKMIDHKILVDETLQIFFETLNKIEGYLIARINHID